MLAFAVSSVLLAGCGEEGLTAATACNGKPTAEAGQEKTLFGALDRLTPESMCRRLGRPTSLKVNGSRQTWEYDGLQLVYDEEAKRIVDVRPPAG